MSFVFYDTETTGLKPGFDQIVQFAAIRTDAYLVELDRFEIRCRLQPHVIPHPSALRANRISIARLTEASQPSHYEMVCAIRRRLAAWGPGIFIGYNSIRFDEEMLRHAFFQSLFPAYLTSAPGNGRTDAMNLLLAACAEPEPCLTLPIGPTGRTTFRLEAVAEANGLTLGPAHDALVDAATTLELCRRIRTSAPDVWHRFIRFSNKAVVRDFVETEEMFFLTRFFGGEANHSLVARLGSPAGDANGHLCWDLAQDPALLDDALADALTEAVLRKGGPVKRLRTNAAPALCASWEAPDAWFGIDAATAEGRAAWLRENPGFCGRAMSAYTDLWADTPPAVHPEQQLYNGVFPGPSDEALMVDFHEEGKRRRLEIVERLEDSRAKVFGRRLIYCEHRSALNETERSEADIALAESLVDERGAGLTLPQALILVEEALAAGGEDPDGVLAEYQVWLKARLARTVAFLGRPPVTSVAPAV